jgi:hypothetical protein
VSEQFYCGFYVSFWWLIFPRFFGFGCHCPAAILERYFGLPRWV